MCGKNATVGIMNVYMNKSKELRTKLNTVLEMKDTDPKKAFMKLKDIYEEANKLSERVGGFEFNNIAATAQLNQNLIKKQD